MPDDGGDDLDFDRVLALVEVRRWDDALSILGPLLARSPQDPVLWVTQAEILTGLDKHDDAVVALRRAVVEAPDSPFIQRAFALGLLAVGRHQAALSAARSAIALDSSEADGHVVLVFAALAAGQLDLAKEEARRGIELEPTRVTTLNAVAVVALNNGNLDTAHEFLHRALAVDPLNPAVRNNLALLQSATGDFSSAMNTFGSLVAERPDDPSLRFRLGALARRHAYGQGPVALLLLAAAVLWAAEITLSKTTLVVAAALAVVGIAWYTARLMTLPRGVRSAYREFERKEYRWRWRPHVPITRARPLLFVAATVILLSLGALIFHEAEEKERKAGTTRTGCTIKPIVIEGHRLNPCP